MAADGRTCGGCDACCSVLNIPELNSPAFSRPSCMAECGGCGMYDDRPSICRGFECVWLMEDPELTGLGEEHRPDRLGVVIHGQPHPEHGEVLMFSECQQDAFNKVDVLRLVDRYSSSIVVQLVRNGQHMFVDNRYRAEVV